jgi:hypothetical protein
VRVWYDLKRYYDANLLPVAICRGSTITSGEMDRRKVSTRLWSIGAPKKRDSTSSGFGVLFAGHLRIIISKKQ